MKLTLKTFGASLVCALVATSATAGTLNIETSKTIPLRLAGEAASVVLGNNNIADVAVHSPNLLFLTGKTYGSTNLLVFNKDGEQIYSAEIVVTSNTASFVTVTRSGSNFTYDCATDCRPVLSIGDDLEQFGSLADQNMTLQELAEGQE